MNKNNYCKFCSELVNGFRYCNNCKVAYFGAKSGYTFGIKINGAKFDIDYYPKSNITTIVCDDETILELEGEIFTPQNAAEKLSTFIGVFLISPTLTYLDNTKLVVILSGK